MTQIQRQSNFELLRIVAMAVIVAHHYVVNSTVMEQFVQGGNELTAMAQGRWPSLPGHSFRFDFESPLSRHTPGRNGWGLYYKRIRQEGYERDYFDIDGMGEVGKVGRAGYKSDSLGVN